MPTFTAHDVVLIHRAIHARDPPVKNVETSLGAFAVKPTKYNSFTVCVETDNDGGLGAEFVGANPQKSSRYGLKARAGGAVTLINSDRTKGYEATCIVLESLNAIGPITVSKQHTSTTISGMAEADINVMDKSRMRDPAAQEEEEEASGVAKKPKGNGKAITSVESAKTGRARCKQCGEKIEKGELRVGSANNYRGTPTTDWRKASCVSLTAEQAAKLEGFEALSENLLHQLLGMPVANGPATVVD